MKKLLPYIAGALLFAAVLFLLLNRGPRNFDGRITLNHRDKIPYGTFAAYELLKKQFPEADIQTNKYAPDSWQELSFDTSKQFLLIVNSYFNPSETELDNLTAFAQKGNYVFISALQMNEAAQKYYRINEENYYNTPLINESDEGIKAFDSFSVSLDTIAFQYPSRYSYPGVSYDNYFIKADSLFSYPLGYADNIKPDLIAIKTGKGVLFIHSAPITFTNFFLLYNNNHQYYEKLMSLVPAGIEKVVWDEYFLYKRSDDSQDSGQGLLHVIFQYKNFRWAFWVAIVLLCLYVFTEIKRRQRMIPLYQKPANDSLEFVQTVGKLYYEKGDHKNLAEKLTLFFFDHLRSKYKIATNDINTKFAETTALKTNVPLHEVNEIVDYIHTIQSTDNISRKQLMDYYDLLENFYKKA